MGKRILIVDDSATVRQQVRSALEGAGFAVTEAVDGADAVNKIEGGFSAVVCDVNMPRMNGVQFVQTVKQKPEHAAIPILMLTTEGSPDTIRKAREAGARGWIVKPFKPDQLVAAMNKLTA